MPNKKLSKKENSDNNQKRQIKLLKSIVESLINKQSAEIIDLLAGKKNVNEFAIAKNLNLTINQTRNILYKLSDFGLVSFIRKKDKRKGWYIYFWTLNIFQAFNLFGGDLNKRLNILEGQLKNRKESRHYMCNTCSIEVNEETALLNDFICPECDEVYQLSDDSEVIKDLENKIQKLNKEIEMVSEHQSIEGDKLDKEKAKKIQKSDEERKDKRRMAMKKRKMEREKEANESGKVKDNRNKNNKNKLKKKTVKKKPERSSKTKSVKSKSNISKKSGKKK